MIFVVYFDYAFHNRLRQVEDYADCSLYVVHVLPQLAVYLLMMLKHIHGAAESAPAAVESSITDWARAWATSTHTGLGARSGGAALGPEADALLRHDEVRWARQASRTRSVIAK